MALRRHFQHTLLFGLLKILALSKLSLTCFSSNPHKIVILRGCDFIDFSREVIEF